MKKRKVEKLNVGDADKNAEDLKHNHDIGIICDPLKEDGDLKADEGKLRYDLIPETALEGIATIFTYGSKKYDDNNWKKSTYPSRYYAAMMRHIQEIRKGNLIDKESGLYHFDHALVCLIMYRELTLKQQ